MKKIGRWFLCILLFSAFGGVAFWADQHCFFDFPPGKRASFALQDLLEKKASCVVKKIDFYQLNFWIKTWRKEVAEKADFFLGEQFEKVEKFDQDLKKEYSKLQDQELSKAFPSGTEVLSELEPDVFQIRSDSELFPFSRNPSAFIAPEAMPNSRGKGIFSFMGKSKIGARGLLYFAQPKIKDRMLAFSLFTAENSPVGLRFAIFTRRNIGDKGNMLTEWSDWIPAGESATLRFDTYDNAYLNRGVFVQIEHNGKFWEEERSFAGWLKEER